MDIVLFSKALPDADASELAGAIRSLRLDGVDLTVRAGGHVLPEHVRDELPRVAKVIAHAGLTLALVTTDVRSADEPHAEELFSTAATLGVKELKLGYWAYEFGRIREQIAAAQHSLADIEALARAHGVRASIHTHAGPWLSATPGVLHLLLKDRDPTYVGAYVDAAHMIIDGRLGGWVQGLDLLRDYISVVGVKDIRPIDEPEIRVPGFPAEVVPVGKGIVPWDEWFGRLGDLGWDGIVSLHSEYHSDASWRRLGREELLAQTELDTRYVERVSRGRGFERRDSDQFVKASNGQGALYTH